MLYKKDFRPSVASRLVDLFTKRNLWALVGIRESITRIDTTEAARDALAFALQSMLLINSKMCGYETTQTQNGTYYLPPIYKELVPINSVANKVRVRASAEEVRNLATNACSLSTQSATHLEAIPGSSVDLVFTDPPYAGKVQYGELNFVWEAWLGFDADWHDAEITVNETRGIDEQDWARMMRQAMAECCRVLKPGRWVSLCYHDTSEGTWALVQDIMAEAGFIADRTDSALYIDAAQKSYNQLTAQKVTKRDLVINFRKPRPGETGQLTLAGAEDTVTFRQKARAILREALEAHPGATADRLYDELVSRMVRRGEFERHDFDALLRSVAEPVTEPVMANLFEREQPNLFGTHERIRWYLKETADEADEAEGAKEDAAARRLVAFMRAYLEEHPDETGVHYGYVFEHYLPVQDKPRRQLAEWLPEFFYRTEEGTWRPPQTEDERLLKEELRQGGMLRRVKRFARALLVGVPPAERDVPANAATALEWLRHCVRAGLYDLGQAIYLSGGIDWSALPAVSALDAQEQYELCVRRMR